MYRIIYLNIPYADKEEAKALGCKWNPKRKKWFIENPTDITLYQKWCSCHVEIYQKWYAEQGNKEQK